MTSAAADAWSPPGPSEEDGFDWIQLKSGEWLKGRIKFMQNETLEFDSEELDLLSFDWDDVVRLRSTRLNSVRFGGLIPMDGLVAVTRDDVEIVTPTATNTFPRANLLAITPTGHNELDKWAGKISLGVSFRAGNTRQVDISSYALFRRSTPKTRLDLEYLGNYSKVNGVEMVENHRAVTRLDYFLSRRFYARLPDAEYYRDPPENIDHRLTLGGGIGYDILKAHCVEWNVTIGPAWQRTWFHSVPAGEDGAVDALAYGLASRFEVDMTRNLTWSLEYRGYITRHNAGNNTHHAISTLEFEIHKHFKLDLSFVWDRISSPQTQSNGEMPTPDDFRLITSLGVDF